ncbi:MAG: hypothetical protein KDB00_03155 [Planctomycetales bacterium]|nr:hypothetical protein [Planctomycetales bacterium]
MREPSDLNDLYQEWLEIPADRLPPNHYALLGLDDYEADEARIEAAAKSRSAYLHQIAAGPQRKIVQDMLGQVAIARRTLMSGEKRQKYDNSLRSNLTQSPAAELASSVPGAGPDAMADQRGESLEHDSVERSDLQGTAPAQSRSKASDWKYHGISAVVLLLIVGGVYIVNRNPGGRRAAQARIGESTGSPENVTATNSNSADEDRTESSPHRKANPRIASVRAANQSSSKRPSPIAKRRETGSGIGSGLGDKFADVLSDIANQPSATSRGDSPKSNNESDSELIDGLVIGGSEETDDPESATHAMALVTEFPSGVEKRFQCDRGFKWYAVDKTKMVVASAEGDNVFELSDKQFSMSAGAGVSLTTSLAAKMRPEMQVAIVVDQIRVGLRPSTNGVEVYVGGRSSDSQVNVIKDVNTSAKSTTLTVIREIDAPETIRWFVSAADQSFTGMIGVDSLAAQPQTSIQVTASKKQTERSFWISDLKTRTQ